ncbi:MAG: DUF1922 domain-containing protein [Candidatus Heimdallarchaeota archaeon]|nr:DUF1922 domain-containing protein [Candidatus Heimdallarchaeota archaeon]
MSAEYYVIRCGKRECGKFSYSKTSQKTKMCPYCERRIVIEKANKTEVNSVIHARKLVQEFNKKLGEMTEPWWYNSKN